MDTQLLGNQGCRVQGSGHAQFGMFRSAVKIKLRCDVRIRVWSVCIWFERKRLWPSRRALRSPHLRAMANAEPQTAAVADCFSIRRGKCTVHEVHVPLRYLVLLPLRRVSCLSPEQLRRRAVSPSCDALFLSFGPAPSSQSMYLSVHLSRN